jgi:hypothetical protein
MLKSTYKPSANAPQPLPQGWTEHKAPTGHIYYFNAATQESTYQRPGANPPLGPAPPPPNPHASFMQYASVPQLSDPATANAYLAQYNPSPQYQNQQQRQPGGARGGHHGGDRPRPQPHDKPKSKVAIPGCEPWILVYTKYGRRFAYNPVKNASYWRMPEKVKQAVLELDIQGIKAKAAGDGKAEGDSTEPNEESDEKSKKGEQAPAELEGPPEEEQEELGSDYEEVEVTDDEEEDGEEGEDGEHLSKRQRTEEAPEDVPVEMNEDDIAFQLQAMGEELGLDPGEYDDGNPDAWPEGAEGLSISDEDSRALFKYLLEDYGINPYSPWEKLIEEGKIFDDPRYTVLSTMKARKEVWEEWSREQIHIIRERRAKEEKKDPRISYMAFLQEKATPKLYWPEFRRKYRKEAPMRDSSLSEKDREKWYREYVSRLKMPQDSLKKDLSTLLRSLPAKDLHNKTVLQSLPTQVLVDVRYISLDAKVRDPLIEAYISTLGPPPEKEEAEHDEAERKARDDRRKRERALQEREKVVAEEKRKQQRQLEYGRAALREEERELERAMHVDKKGLQGQLLAAREDRPEGGEQAP